MRKSQYKGVPGQNTQIMSIFVLAITWKLLVRQLCAQQQNCVIFDYLSDDTHYVSVASEVFEH